MKHKSDIEVAVEAAERVEVAIARLAPVDAIARRVGNYAIRAAWTAAALARAETVWNADLQVAIRDCFDGDALRDFAKGKRDDIGGARFEHSSGSAGAAHG